MTRGLGVVLALAVGVAADAPPSPRGAFWRWWENPTITAEIGLTSRQAADIARAHAETGRDRAERSRQLREQRARLGELLSAPEADIGEITRVMGRIARLERDQLRAVVHLRLRVRRILGREQVLHLLARYPALMRRPWQE